MTRRRVALVLVVLVVVALAVMLWALFGSRESSLERWCATQVLAIANDNINPTLTCAGMNYTFPKTLLLTGVAVTAGKTDIIKVESIRIELAEIPRRGRPILIGSLELTRPEVRLIEQADGTLLGLSDFVETGGAKKEADGGSSKLSDVLAIQVIKITDGALQYEPPKASPMVLRPLDLELHGEVDKGGWYGFDAKADLEPVVDLNATARLNLDSGDLDFTKLTAHTELREPQYQVFPPQIQKILRDHDITGTLDGTMSGPLPLSDMSKVDLAFKIKLTDASVAFGELAIPVKSVDAEGRLDKDVLDFPKIAMDVFGGTARVGAEQWLAGDRAGHFEIEVDGEGLHLEETLRHRGEGPPAHSGLVALNGQVFGTAGDLPGSLGGSGEATLTEGRLAIVNVLRNLLARKDARGNDRGTCTFEIHPDAIQYLSFQIVGGAMGITGSGKLFYNGDIDMLANAGPLERVEGLLGPVGEVLKLFTDRLVPYQVTGTALEPKIAPRPLGLGTRN